MIVTEYMENGALDRYLRVSWSNRWITRYWTVIMAVLRFFLPVATRGNAAKNFILPKNIFSQPFNYKNKHC